MYQLPTSRLPQERINSYGGGMDSGKITLTDDTQQKSDVDRGEREILARTYSRVALVSPAGRWCFATRKELSHFNGLKNGNFTHQQTSVKPLRILRRRKRVSIHFTNMAYSSRTLTKNCMKPSPCVSLCHVITGSYQRQNRSQTRTPHSPIRQNETNQETGLLRHKQPTKHAHLFTQRRKMVIRALDRTGAAPHCCGCHHHYPDPQPPLTLSISLGYCQ